MRRSHPAVTGPLAADWRPASPRRTGRVRSGSWWPDEPYRPAGADAAKRAEDRGVLRAAALAVHRSGRAPVAGVDMAPPIAAAAGHDHAADEEATMLIALAFADRRDARPRTGGPSDGADEGTERSKAAGRPLSRAIGGVPGAVGP